MFRKNPTTEKAPVSQKRIFISYRRSDSAGHAGRLYDYLKNYFGAERIFFDADTIRPGANFEQKISDELDRSEAMLALIGNQWLDSKDKDGNRRLESAHDYVRFEVETALAKNIQLIPVLLQGTQMPSPGMLPETLGGLSMHNAIRLNDDHWNSDCKLLAEIIKSTLNISRSIQERKIRRYRIIVFVLFALVTLLAVLNQVLNIDYDPWGRLLTNFLTLFVIVNVALVTYLLGNIKKELDRLSWIIIGVAIVACLMIAQGGYWTLAAAFMMVLEAGLLNFVEADV
ncbi:MAG: toll/interleukin-1 receptor domain-containing protein [Syntrophothermus sp.]